MKDSKKANTEEIEVVTLEDSQGEEIDFEVVATLEHEGQSYIVLLPLGDDDADEYTILRYVPNDGGEINEFYGIDDYNTLMAVYKQFCAEYEEAQD